MSGFFITFEGTEGVGKTTQVQRTCKLLEAKHPGRVVRAREPGGTPSGEAIRNVMLQAGPHSLDGMTEMLLMFAARRQHLREVIEPALKAGKIIVCDRFTDATYAYQGGGRGVEEQHIAHLQKLVQGNLGPHLTLLLDVPVETGLTRLRTRNLGLDRIETETLHFFRQVRNKYLELAQRYPERIHVIDATGDIDDVGVKIRTVLEKKNLC